VKVLCREVSIAGDNAEAQGQKTKKVPETNNLQSVWTGWNDWMEV